MASRKKDRPSGQQIDLTVTRVPADEARVRAIVEALAEVGLAYLRARHRPTAAPQSESHPEDERGGVA